MDYTSDEIIAGILFFFPGDHYLTTNRMEIHKTLFKLREKGNYFLLEPFSFSTKYISPISTELENALWRLSLARIISLYDPEFPKFEIRPVARKYIEKKILYKFTREEQAQLKLIARELAKECGEKVQV